MRELLVLRLGPLGWVATIAIVLLPVAALMFHALKRSRRLISYATPSRRSGVTDLAYLWISPITETCTRIATTSIIVVCALALGQRVGPSLLRGFGPVVMQPRWLVLVEMIVLGDFIYYWVHRMAHVVPLLWRFHAVHHSTRHLMWTSALRAHPVEGYVHVLNVAPLFLLGFPIDAVAPLTPIFTAYGLWIHSDLKLAWRPLRFVANTPAFHRWHHALDTGADARNFAGLFPLFDALFGTYHLPDHAPKAFGIDDATMPETFVAQLKHPFAAHSPVSPHATDHSVTHAAEHCQQVAG